MKQIIEYLNEANKIKMSKIFSNQDTLQRALIGRSNIMSNDEYDELIDAIWKEYKIFPNSYIFSEDKNIYLAFVSKYKDDSGKVKNAFDKYSISIFIPKGMKVYKLVFSGYKDFLTGLKDSENLLQDFKNGISLNELLKKYNYNNYSILDDSIKKMINNLNKY